MDYSLTKKAAEEQITAKLSHFFGVTPEEANYEQFYKAIAMITRDMLRQGRHEFEKRCDDAVSDYLAGAQMIPFGEAPLLAYLAARETEYTNIRILLMGRAAGLSPEVIRSRLRRTCA